MNAIKTLNLGLSFFLELGMLASIGYWGFSMGEQWIEKAKYGVGIPLLVMVIWGIYCAPKSASRLKGWPLEALEILLLGLGAAALFLSGQIALGWIYAALLLLNRVLRIYWKQ